MPTNADTADLEQILLTRIFPAYSSLTHIPEARKAVSDIQAYIDQHYISKDKVREAIKLESRDSLHSAIRNDLRASIKEELGL